MTKYVFHIPKKQSDIGRKWIAQGVRHEEGAFWGAGNVLKLDCGDANIYSKFTKNSKIS